MSITLLLLWSAVLLWLMIVLAGLLKYEAWTWPGIQVMVGNREDVPPPSRLAGRADRAARNMIENMMLFVALAAAVHFAGKESGSAQLGANIFFWARVAYWPAYLAGIIYLRTALWTVGIIGLAMMVLALA